MNDVNEQYQLNSAVLFLVFNRLDVTKIVFEAIRQAKPPRLYVASDGPRISREDESEIVMNVRDYVLHNVDWNCEVLTLFRDENLGCKIAVSSAISWFFEKEEEGIILEDDCLPSSTFFRYCDDLLALYRNDTRIGMISGNNNQFGKNVVESSYYYSKYPSIWGWASWKRVWDSYDVNLKQLPNFLGTDFLKYSIPTKSESLFWKNNFESVQLNQVDTWDYQFVCCMWMQQFLSVIPKVNLVSNIGFGPNATHTKGASIFSKIPTENLTFPLISPTFKVPNYKADQLVSMTLFGASKPKKLLVKLVALFRKLRAIMLSGLLK